MPRKEKIINWADVLKKWFTLSRVKKENYREIASEYSRCAVGEQRMRHPKVVVYSLRNEMQREPVPTDQSLYDLGYQFYERLNDACYAKGYAKGEHELEAEAIEKAKNILREIKERVKELTKEQPHDLSLRAVSDDGNPGRA